MTFCGFYVQFTCKLILKHVEAQKTRQLLSKTQFHFTPSAILT